jgi:hypothetical protein
MKGEMRERKGLTLTVDGDDERMIEIFAFHHDGATASCKNRREKSESKPFVREEEINRRKKRGGRRTKNGLVGQLKVATSESSRQPVTLLTVAACG